MNDMDERKMFVDIHSHIIFGADDGASSLQEAIELLKLDREEGAAAVFATPHYGRENNYIPDAAFVMQKFELLKERAAQEVPEITLYLGTEWYCAWNLAKRIHRRDAFRMNDTDYILTDFLELNEKHETKEKIRSNLLELKTQGFIPVLAHAECYKALQENWNALRELTDEGVLLQVNAYDLQQTLSLQAKELAQWLAGEHLISFIGSDMHGLPPKRTPKVKTGVRWLYENTDKAYADAVCFGNAEKLLGVSLTHGFTE